MSSHSIPSGRARPEDPSAAPRVLSFRLPLAGRVARGDSDPRRRLGGRCASPRPGDPTRAPQAAAAPSAASPAWPRTSRAERAGERASDRAGPGRAGGGAQGEAGGPAPTTDRPTDRPEAGVPEARSPRRLPGRLAAPSRWEATQEGPVSLSPMPRAPPMSLTVARKFGFL